MARISLKEQYDNQSVIKQIVDLTDQIDGYDEEIEQATQTATDAKTAADAAKKEADAVKETADNALTVASDAKTVADAAATKNEEQDTELAEIDTKLTELGNKDAEQDTEIAALKAKDTEQDAAIEAVKETADNSLADVTIQTDAVSASLLLKSNLAAESSKAVPLASETATGMMTKATYLALTDAENRIAVLEGKTIVVYVSFTSDDPSQEEITNLFEAKAGKAPVAGNQAIDIARSLAYQYSGAEWIKTTQEVGQWTNSTAGIVKGTPAGSENAGTIFAETDGTGSVNGWDDLVARVANNESAIATTIPSTYATKVALDATDANVANIKTTADNATTKNEEQDTEISGLKTTVSTHSQNIASLEEAVTAVDGKANLCYKDAALSEDQSKLVLTRTDGQTTEVTLPSGGGSGGQFADFTELIELSGSYTGGESTTNVSPGYFCYSVTIERFLTVNCLFFNKDTDQTGPGSIGINADCYTVAEISDALATELLQKCLARLDLTLETDIPKGTVVVDWWPAHTFDEVPSRSTKYIIKHRLSPFAISNDFTNYVPSPNTLTFTIADGEITAITKAYSDSAFMMNNTNNRVLIESVSTYYKAI